LYTIFQVAKIYPILSLVQGGEHGAILTVTLNDMGNYGCYPDCAERVSLPLYTEAAVNLIRRRPMSSLVAHSK
jgi:hypothetical protein